MAQQLSEGAPASKTVLIDCFAGVGGNTIAFASSGRWKRVYAIEKDENAVLCGKHNAKLYGVDGLISWFHGDCFEVIKNELEPLSQHSVVFASPPWGGQSAASPYLGSTQRILGPGYSTDPVFNLGTMQPYSLDGLLDSFQQFTQEIALFLPRTSDLQQLANANRSLERVKAIHYCMEGASKVC